MQPVRLYIFLDKLFEEAFENSQWRKVKQMQPMQLYASARWICEELWICIFLFNLRHIWKYTVEKKSTKCNQSDYAYSHAGNLRKQCQAKPMRLCIFSGKSLEDTFVNAQWRKVKQMQPMWQCLFSGKQFKDTFENAQWRKAKQMQPM